jgi:small subunit ribosomal protein S17
MAEQPRRRTVEVGVVTSAKMEKTIKVEVERRRQHPRYKKYVRRRTVYFARDEARAAHEGDWVEIVPARPLSKRVRWRLLRVLPKPVKGARSGAVAPASAAAGGGPGDGRPQEGGPQHGGRDEGGAQHATPTEPGQGAAD